jgi:DNA-binding Lrp family transcriptional regulator
MARTQATLTNREVAEKLHISRQAVHRHLDKLVRAGVLRREGKGRSVRYALAARRWAKTYPLRALAEDEVWAEVDASPLTKDVPENVRSIASYVVTEAVNNAIDHSDGKEVEVTAEIAGDELVLEVRDDGVGAFAHVREALELPTDLDAIAELSKGRVTTAPDRHTGEGLFFISKVADLFRLESNGRAWIVDNARNDVAVGPSAVELGTLLHFEVARHTDRSLRAIFDAYTDNFEFTRTRIVVRLFEHGVEFVSRSEAKRLLSGLEKFREVVLDFRGVRMLGQGFADEVFRVWANTHPRTVVRHENASDEVEFMVRRALSR